LIYQAIFLWLEEGESRPRAEKPPSTTLTPGGLCAFHAAPTLVPSKGLGLQPGYAGLTYTVWAKPTHARSSTSTWTPSTRRSRRYSRADGSFELISIDCPSQCSTSAFLKSRPRLSLIQFSAVSLGNWPCHFPILGSQAEHSVGVSRSRADQNLQRVVSSTQPQLLHWKNDIVVLSPLYNAQSSYSGASIAAEVSW